MEKPEDKNIILEQYKIYSEAKERFIDRQFSTNRFFLAINLILLVIIHILSTLTPQLQPIILLGVIGFVLSIMWWMNIDSYQVLIKIKYANVLEYLETFLPEQPYRKEYEDYKQIKKKNKLIVFSDFQKILAVVIACVYFFVVSYNVANIIMLQML